MNKTLIASNSSTNIYFIKDEKSSFYISIPTNHDNLSIAINILDNSDNLNPTISSGEQIQEQLNKVYQNFKDIAAITPIIDSNLTEQLKLNNNEQIFNYTDKIISYLINQSYKLLTSENINVNNIIKLNNNKQYQEFNNWFIKKYNGRVELIDNNQVLTPPNIETPNIEEKTEEQNIASEVLENTNTISVIDDNEDKPAENVGGLGFVSYVLLGVIVAVISLIILYMLL